jgi:hypothetical protein
LPHDRRRRFKPNADPAAFVDIASKASAVLRNLSENRFRHDATGDDYM